MVSNTLYKNRGNYLNIQNMYFISYLHTRILSSIIKLNYLPNEAKGISQSKLVNSFSNQCPVLDKKIASAEENFMLEIFIKVGLGWRKMLVM